MPEPETVSAFLPVNHLNVMPGTYRLSLDDNTTWSLQAMEALQHWLDAFARIMGLPPGDAPALHSIFFVVWEQETAGHFLAEHGIEAPWQNKNWLLYKHSKALCYWQHPASGNVVFAISPEFIDHQEIRYIAMWTALRPVFSRTAENGGTPIHAASAQVNGKGILIAASGGTGKSTCYRRLPPDWKRLADDQALIVRQNPSLYRIHPLPSWSEHLWNQTDNTWDFHDSIELHALFLLEQDTIDEVVPVSSTGLTYDMFRSCKEVWESHWVRLERDQRSIQSSLVFNNVSDIARHVPAYRLKATLNGSFWEEIEKVL